MLFNGYIHRLRMRILRIIKIRRIHEFLRILKMLMNLKKIEFAIVKITDMMEIFDANVLIQLVIEGNSIVSSAEPTLACQ